MAKFILDTRFDFGFQLIGLTCHESEYRLCAYLNRELRFSFVREKPLELKIKKLEKSFNFSLFSSSEEGSENLVYLINNQSISQSSEVSLQTQKIQGSLFDEIEDVVSTKFFLIPEKPEIDYFLMLNGEFSDNWLYNLKLKLGESELILNSSDIDASKLSSKNNLLF